MVERPLCMREVLGSTPGFSIQSQRPTLRLSFLTGGVLRRTQIATVVSNRTAFATRDDNFTQLFGEFQLKIYFRLLPRSFPSHFIITGATIKSLIINERLLWETSLLFTIGPMHAYHQSPTSYHQASLLKNYFQTSKIFHICHVGILSIHTALGIHWCQCSRYQALNVRLGGETRASFVNMHEAHHKNYCHRRFGYLHDVIFSSIFCFPIGRDLL